MQLNIGKQLISNQNHRQLLFWVSAMLIFFTKYQEKVIYVYVINFFQVTILENTSYLHGWEEQ
jgi:hypothetical protein